MLQHLAGLGLIRLVGLVGFSRLVSSIAAVTAGGLVGLNKQKKNACIKVTILPFVQQPRPNIPQTRLFSCF